MAKMTKEDRNVLKHILLGLERLRDQNIDAAIEKGGDIDHAINQVREILRAYDAEKEMFMEHFGI